MKTNILFIISPSLLLRIRRFRTKVVEKIQTHILCSIAFLILFENRSVYEIVR
jgi:hypothetical protein